MKLKSFPIDYLNMLNFKRGNTTLFFKAVVPVSLFTSSV